jgi:hypothetical protein
MDVFHYIPHTVGTIIGGGLIYLGKKYVETMLERFDHAFEDIEEIKDNHLPHLQKVSEKTNEILERIEVNQAEMNGFLKGIVGK